MPFLHRPGCDLYYEVTGAGPAVVFAHGFGGNHLSWWQQVSHLAERHTCVTFSHRGFGPSREDAGGPGPAAFADDLGALLDRLGVGDVRLVVQSMGGWTCLGYALRAPGRVRSLVMASTFGSLADPELDALLVARRPSARGDQTSGVHPGRGRTDGARAAGAALALPGDRGAERRRPRGGAVGADRPAHHAARSAGGALHARAVRRRGGGCGHPAGLGRHPGVTDPGGPAGPRSCRGALGLLRARRRVQSLPRRLPLRGRTSLAGAPASPAIGRPERSERDGPIEGGTGSGCFSQAQAGAADPIVVAREGVLEATGADGLDRRRVLAA